MTQGRRSGLYHRRNCDEGRDNDHHSKHNHDLTTHHREYRRGETVGVSIGMATGEVFAFTFDQAGNYPYICTNRNQARGR